jgi:cytochrome c-type biogenesis protein CcmH
VKNLFTKLLIFFIFFHNIAFALTPEYKLSNEVDENRAQKLFLEIRCLVCSGQVIENSDSQFAINVRLLVRKKITEGLNDQEIKAHLIKNFGEEILQTPTIESQPILWILPFFFFIIALFFISRKYHKFYQTKKFTI